MGKLRVRNQSTKLSRRGIPRIRHSWTCPKLQVPMKIIACELWQSKKPLFIACPEMLSHCHPDLLFDFLCASVATND